MTDFIAKALVLLGAVPTWGAAAVGLLVTFQLEVIPLLPDAWALQVAAWTASAIAILSAVVGVVSRVTPAKPADQGLLPPG
jgi:hypothetical protein